MDVRFLPDSSLCGCHNGCTFLAGFLTVRLFLRKFNFSSAMGRRIPHGAAVRNDGYAASFSLSKLRPRSKFFGMTTAPPLIPNTCTLRNPAPHSHQHSTFIPPFPF